MIRVLIAEDSVTDRELLVEILRSDPEFEVVGQAGNGARAVELARELRPDLITMDVLMPVLDGLEATKEIMVQTPTPILVVSSTLGERGVELSLHAIRAGALMAVEKPGAPGSPGFAERRAQLLSLAKAMAQVKVVRRWATSRRPAPLTDGAAGDKPAGPVRLIAIAGSTGGPAALHRVLADLPGDFPLPLVVVQHIATGFVAGLAEWLRSSCNLRVKVAEDGEPLAARTAYLASDDRHLGVSRERTIEMSRAGPINGFRPSATHLFETAARAYGPAVTAVVLTGMGSDGVEGLRAVKQAGGRVIAQNEATSVIYGMPREAVAAGVVDLELPITEIGPRLTALVAGRK
jgi:two-component system, chemotaxis family, protein-glutamate methylesterase/glutaminase